VLLGVTKLHFNFDVDHWQFRKEGDVEDGTRHKLLRSFSKMEKPQVDPRLLWDLALALGWNGIALYRKTLLELRRLTGRISRASAR